MKALVLPCLTFIVFMAVTAVYAGEESLGNPFCQAIQQAPVRELIFEHLSDLELAKLAQAYESVGVPVAEEIANRRAYLERVTNAVDVWCMSLYKRLDNDALKQYVLQKIEEVSKENPGRCINLYLYDNGLGRNPEFFKSLMNAITEKVYQLKIDIMVLDLSLNQIRMLPEDFFDRMFSLHELFLSLNKDLTTLPERIFIKLHHLKTLYLPGGAQRKSNAEFHLSDNAVVHYW
jgi:hypothetical protein